MRKTLFAVVVALVLTAGAFAADNLALRVTAETPTTITFGWVPPAGANGYDFYVAGKRVSNTRDGTRSSVRFAKVDCAAAPDPTRCYEVAWSSEGGRGAYPGAPVPPKAQCQNGIDDDGDGKIDYPADPGCTGPTDNDERDPAPPTANVFVNPQGNDSSCSRGGSACATWNRAYQIAQPGDIVSVAGGTYPSQVIQSKASNRNLSPGCTPTSTSKCITFVPAGQVTIGGILEVRGSSVYVKGARNTPLPQANSTYTINAVGYADVEANSNADHPDHVVLEGIRTVSTGVFNADTVTLKDMGVGPSTAFWGGSSEVCCREGSGMENKIGFGGGVTYVPKDVTLDGLYIQRQNGDSSRLQPGADVHFGGLFIVTVDGLTIKGSVFDRNVVYHIQIQNFDGPRAKRVLIDGNSFGCPVDWLYEGDVCDGQHAIQFDYDPGSEFTISNNASANGAGGLFACYVGACGGLTGVKAFGNVDHPQSPSPPPLPGS